MESNRTGRRSTKDPPGNNQDRHIMHEVKSVQLSLNKISGHENARCDKPAHTLHPPLIS